MIVDIEEEKGKFVRDTDNMAILNVDKTALLKDDIYKRRVKKDTEFESAINTLQSEVSSMKETLNKIVELLNSNRGS